MEERVRKDIWYIENWSFLLDIQIILKTIRLMLLGDKHAY
jgi:putative colanic acid biosynthesis UDP-glucose lipid carrier transferase